MAVDFSVSNSVRPDLQKDLAKVLQTGGDVNGYKAGKKSERGEEGLRNVQHLIGRSRLTTAASKFYSREKHWID